jgi:hypothetical protein
MRGGVITSLNYRDIRKLTRESCQRAHACSIPSFGLRQIDLGDPIAKLPNSFEVTLWRAICPVSVWSVSSPTHRVQIRHLKQLWISSSHIADITASRLPQSRNGNNQCSRRLRLRNCFLTFPNLQKDLRLSYSRISWNRDADIIWNQSHNDFTPTA